MVDTAGINAPYYDDATPMDYGVPMKELPDVGLGPLICERSSQAAYWAGGAMLIFVGVAAGRIAAALLRGSSPPGPVPAALGVSALLFIAIGALVVRKGFFRTRFYEHGVATFAFGHPRMVLPYFEVATLTFRLQRLDFHGVPIGTVVTMQLRGNDKRRASYSGSHRTRTRAEGFLGLSGPRRVIKVDEIDGVRECVAEAIADRLAESVLEGRPINWCGAAIIFEAGITPRQGRSKGTCIPYAHVSEVNTDDDTAFLFRDGEHKPFLKIPLCKPNSFPCVALLNRLRAAAPTEAPPAGPIDPDPKPVTGLPRA